MAQQLLFAPSFMTDDGSSGAFLPSDMSAANDHASHPNFGHLTLLVFEAVLEVVCVSLPGYIVARRGMFDAGAQKFVANLNMTLFTPCLIFSKLASQLSGDRLLELAVIPLILLAQTVISWIAAKILSRVFRVKKMPQSNFITAMAVFGNSNSLPLSLVISLSHTISGLHWDKVPGDNDSEVAARGILYLLIFSQLGQAVRWSWGMNALLKPLDQYTPEQRGETDDDEERTRPYKDNSPPSSIHGSVSGSSSSPAAGTEPLPVNAAPQTNGKAKRRTLSRTKSRPLVLDGVLSGTGAGIESSESSEDDENPPIVALSKRALKRADSWWVRTNKSAGERWADLKQTAQSKSQKAFQKLPTSLQRFLSVTGSICWKFVANIYACLNVPLVAILFSVLVALVPALQNFFFTKGTFVNNSVTAAINQMGGVAVPLILVVLGANLARNTLPDETEEEIGTSGEQKKMLFLSLICRMLIPTIAMTPILAVVAKYVPVSILDDPIFVIVCFLLSGAPSALQLAQMCQVNGVFVGVVSKLLFHSYVVWILPSTLILVMLALEVVEWAK